MRRIPLKIIFPVLLLVLLNSSIFGQQKSIYKYKVIVDLGSDYTDPLFTNFTLIDYIKERMSQRLPEFGYTDFEDANVVLKLTLLTQTGSDINNNYASALNLLITSPFHNPLNWNVLLIESKEEFAKARIRDLIDRWVLEYSAFIYKSTK